jgi:hypothetical protein
MADINELVASAFDSAEGTAEVVNQPNTPANTEAAAAAEPPATTTEAPVTATEQPAATVSATEAEAVPEYLEGVSADEWKQVPEAVRIGFKNTMSAVQDYLGQVVPAARNFEAVHKVVEPHLEFIKQAGVTPLAVIDGTLRMAQALGTGTPERKAEVLAQLITSYGVDLGLLDKTLTAQLQAAQDPVQAAITRQLAPIQQALSAITQRVAPTTQEAQPATDTVGDEVRSFATAKDATGQLKYPHYQQVRRDMADLFSIAAQRNTTLTLEQAYRKACAMNDLPATATAPTQQPIGLSVKGSTSAAIPNSTKKFRSVEEAVAAAIDSHTTH